jgi:hypothetical protein
MNLRIALLMMQKNEATLLEPQIRYHSQFIANASIFLFDNGSRAPRKISAFQSFCGHEKAANQAA